MTFITATTLPLLIALAAIGQDDGVMLPANAAALVGAGVVSVLIFPAAAVTLNRRAIRRNIGDPVPDTVSVAEDSMADGDAVPNQGHRNLPDPALAGEPSPDLDGDS